MKNGAKTLNPGDTIQIPRNCLDGNVVHLFPADKDKPTHTTVVIAGIDTDKELYVLSPNLDYGFAYQVEGGSLVVAPGVKGVIRLTSLANQGIQNSWDRAILVRKYSDKMDDSKSFGELLKSDMEEGAYRAGAWQLSKLARTMLVSVMRELKFEKSTITAVTKALNTEIGTSMVGAGIGWFLTYAPHLKDDPRMMILAKEFRVQGMEKGLNTMADSLLEKFGPQLMQIVNKLPTPPAEKLRIAADEAKAKSAATETEAEAEAEEAVSSSKKKAAA